ncbi:MAG: hypothetical protein ABJ084_10625 [Halioglobus sp.]
MSKVLVTDGTGYIGTHAGAALIDAGYHSLLSTTALPQHAMGAHQSEAMT